MPLPRTDFPKVHVYLLRGVYSTIFLHTNRNAVPVLKCERCAHCCWRLSERYCFLCLPSSLVLCSGTVRILIAGLFAYSVRRSSFSQGLFREPFFIALQLVFVLDNALLGREISQQKYKRLHSVNESFFLWLQFYDGK